MGSCGEGKWREELAETGKECERQGIKADCVPVKSSDGVYIIYTSGKDPLSTPRRRGCIGLAVIL